MDFNISAAARMYGKPRKTLYRHMDSGRLSYSVNRDGSRSVNLAELVRCYGEPTQPMPQGVSEKSAEMSQVDTPSHLAGQVEYLVKLVKHQSEQLEAMRQQIEEIKALPPPPPKAEEATDPEDLAGKPRTFGDLLARLEARRH